MNKKSSDMHQKQKKVELSFNELVTERLVQNSLPETKAIKRFLTDTIHL